MKKVKIVGEGEALFSVAVVVEGPAVRKMVRIYFALF
jgi:hypothetical protein